jgi:hypothetical protein
MLVPFISMLFVPTLNVVLSIDDIASQSADSISTSLP